MEPQIQPVETPKPEKQCKCKPTIILLTIFAVLALGFAGFELWQNIQKSDEIARKDNEISDLRGKVQVAPTPSNNDPMVDPTVGPAQGTDFDPDVVLVESGDKINFYSKDIAVQYYNDFFRTGNQKVICGQGGEVCRFYDIGQADLAEYLVASYQCTTTDCHVSETTGVGQYTTYGLAPVEDGEKRILFDVAKNQVAYEGDFDLIRGCEYPTPETELCLYQEVLRYIPAE